MLSSQNKDIVIAFQRHQEKEKTGDNIHYKCYEITKKQGPARGDHNAKSDCTNMKIMYNARHYREESYRAIHN